MRVLTVAMACAVATAGASASVSDVASFVNAARTFNDFGGSNLTFNANWSNPNASVSLSENNYGAGGFANRHIAWFGDAANNKVDWDYGDGFDVSMVMNIRAATAVDNVEAGFQADLFGFGLFGVLTWNGEIAAFGSILPFHSFGSGLYTVGDDLALRMIHRPGAGENDLSGRSTMEYMYNNLTTGSGWVSSGEIDFTTGEGGIPSSFDHFLGVGAQINLPDAVLGNVVIDYTDINIIPAPGALALLGMSGLFAGRRRR